MIYKCFFSSMTVLSRAKFAESVRRVVGRLLRPSIMIPASCYSRPFMIPSACAWQKPSDLLLMNWIQQRGWCYQNQIKIWPPLLAHLLLVFLLVCSHEASWRVVNCTRARGPRGKELGAASDQQPVKNWATTWWANLEVEPYSVEPYDDHGLGWQSWLIATWNKTPSLASLGNLTTETTR